ncbi:hypothetical protein SLS58_010020 [Diplodia intermedia]|uniref:Uncharacterized protein n=1 Tax=Diplodia intermedia TaxID=856260 RepID=A0ABR3T8P5_9PEZI
MNASRSLFVRSGKYWKIGTESRAFISISNVSLSRLILTSTSGPEGASIKPVLASSANHYCDCAVSTNDTTGHNGIFGRAQRSEADIRLLDENPADPCQCFHALRTSMNGQIPRTCERLAVQSGSYDFEKRLSDNAPATVPPPLDHFSLGLREVSTRLRFIELTHIPILSSTLFWPDAREPTPQEPWWPNLETFSITWAKPDPFGST